MSETPEIKPEAMSEDEDAQAQDVSEAIDATATAAGEPADVNEDMGEEDAETSDMNELEDGSEVTSEEEGAVENAASLSDEALNETSNETLGDAEEADGGDADVESDADAGEEEPHLVAVPEAGQADEEEPSQPFPLHDPAQQLRMVEALFFAAAEPLDVDSIAARLPEGADVGALIEDLQTAYENRGVNLVRVADKFMLRTAEDLSFLMRREAVEQKKLSRAALETLAIIAYHQPVTRAEIEDIRGVSVSKGTIDVLMETTWIRLRGRRRTPGRPVTYGTSDEFMIHFGLENISDLPGLEELKGSGMLEANLPPTFIVPNPSETGGDGDGDFEDEAPEEYGEALDDHEEQSKNED